MANKNPILNDVYPGDVRAPVIDVRRGGQNGFLGAPFQWPSNGLYVQQQLRAFLVAPPKFFQYAEDPQKEVDILKAMIELFPIKIEGLDSTVTIEHNASTPFGAAGEVIETATNATRAASKPSYSYGPDKLNQTFARYWTEFSRMYIMDPDLKVPAIVQSPRYIQAGSPVWTNEDQSFTVIYIETDGTLTNPLKVWLTANHQPTGDMPELKGYREVGASLNTVDIQIQFTGVTQTGIAPMIMAKAILDTINLTDLRPLELGAITSTIDSYVRSSQIGAITNITPSTVAPSFPEAGAA